MTNQLWSVHVIGPDDIYPARSWSDAVTMADDINRYALARNEGYKPGDVEYVTYIAYPELWYGTAESHAECLSLRDAEEAEWQQKCDEHLTKLGLKGKQNEND